MTRERFSIWFRLWIARQKYAATQDHIRSCEHQLAQQQAELDGHLRNVSMLRIAVIDAERALNPPRRPAPLVDEEFVKPRIRAKAGR